MTKEIMDFYENVKSDEEAKKRMLKNIQTLAAEEYESGEGKNNMRLKSKGIIRVAAVAAIALSVPTMAYAAGLFNLNDVNVGKVKVEDFENKQEKQVDMISLQGMVDSPESRASKEWNKFLEEEGADAIDLTEEKDHPKGLGEYAEIYGCYSKKMADKLDEICKKYNLSKLSGFKTVNNEKKLSKEVGIGNIYRTGKEGIENIPLCGYCYSDGTFHFEGSAILGKNENVSYQLTRNVKGTFSNVALTVGDIDDYKQWEYATENGQTLLLANSGYKGLIMLETEKSFVVVNVPAEMGNEELELLAESFDFSVIP